MIPGKQCRGVVIEVLDHYMQQPVNRDDIIGNLVKQDMRVWRYTLTGPNHLQSILNK